MTITLETAAILLSIVSFIVTIFGFFASLKFYRDGVELQKAANNALIKIAEKTESIQAQVGGMFDKTLDAALGKHSEVSANFEDLEKQLSDTKEALLTQVRGQIGEIGEQQQQRIKKTVEEQISLLKEKVESTRESAEEVADIAIDPNPKMSATALSILKAMATTDEAFTPSELEQYLKKYDPSLKISYLDRRLRELAEYKYIAPVAVKNGERKYGLTVRGFVVAKRSA